MTASPECISDCQRQRIWGALDTSTHARIKSLSPAARLLSLTARALVFLLVERAAFRNRSALKLSMRSSKHGGMLLFYGRSFFAHASISHTEGQVAAALSFLGPVGIDIESNRRPGKYLAVSRRVFPASTWSKLARVCPSERASHFFVEWTLREALVKACGLRSIMALQKVSFQKNKSAQSSQEFQPIAAFDVEAGSWDHLAYLGAVTTSLGWQISVAVQHREEPDDSQ